jgi:hypothetical protein
MLAIGEGYPDDTSIPLDGALGKTKGSEEFINESIL